VEISFDPGKRASTLIDRGLDFADAARVFDGPVFEFGPAVRLSGGALVDDRAAGRADGRGDLDRDRRRPSRHINEEGQ
jgi:hypothetical protein